MKLDDSSTSHLQSQLLEYLTGQRFLLVLDDVWTVDYLKWKPLKDLLKQRAKGSRVLVTSRITKVKDIIGTQHPHLLGYLPEDEYWSLFAKIAFQGESLSSQRRKVLEDIDVEQPMLTIVENARKLWSLLFPSHYLKNFGQALDREFRTMRYLRTLDLSSSMILELPSSIDELKLLRYLDLSRTEIKFLPNSICNLYHLETLKILGCPWLFKLPKDLGNLVNLRHMELEDLFWFKLSVLPPKAGNLTRLQNWHAFRLENVVNVVEAKMNEKKYLWKLVFEWSDKVVNTRDDATEKIVLEGLQPHSNLKELQICHYRGNEFPAWMREGRLQNLVSVTLNDCTNCKTLTLGELPNLRVLCIKGMQELEKWPEVRCPSLSRLKFSNCPKLRELPNCFPKLRTVKIKSCKSLRALPVAPSLMILTH
nr:putative disease resistance rpp13-like protein 1 [Quercus suber]